MSLQFLVPFGVEREGTTHGQPPAPEVQSAHAGRAFVPKEDIGDKLELIHGRQFLPDQRRLIKRARPYSCPMQGYWRDNQITAVIGQMPSQLLCNDPRQAYFPAIFQAQRYLRRCIIIFDGSANAVVPRRRLNTRCATGGIATVEFEGCCAGAAPGWTQKFELLPTGCTKWSAGSGNDTTAWTAFWKNPIQCNIKNLAAPCHNGLVGQSECLHKAQMNQVEPPPEIFDRRRRRALRARSARREGDDFLWTHIATDLAERLSSVTRCFENVLIIGPIGRWRDQLLPVDTCCTLAPMDKLDSDELASVLLDEDRLPFPLASFDLVISAGTLDSVNDLPGALVQIRRILRPDGLFLGHMFGAGTLATLKSMLLEADADRARPHVHPQIELRSAADLLVRAGFNLPVADIEAVTVRYGDWRAIISDIRDAGVGNALTGTRSFLGKDFADRLDRIFEGRSDTEGKLAESFVHVHLSGWTPSENQARPAKRGSAQVSLADILSKDRAS